MLAEKVLGARPLASYGAFHGMSASIRIAQGFQYQTAAVIDTYTAPQPMRTESEPAGSG